MRRPKKRSAAQGCQPHVAFVEKTLASGNAARIQDPSQIARGLIAQR